MNHPIFTADMKLADMLLANYRLLFVLPRFGISLGTGDVTVKQACAKYSISTDLFLAICNIYTFDDYLPNSRTLENIEPGELINYLRDSHLDYRTKLLPNVINEILEITECCHRDMFEQFCNKYQDEVIAHFQYEEAVVFPYISALVQGTKTEGYSIQTFEKNHSNIEESLNDLKTILIKFIPGDSGEKSRRALIDLFLLEEDLNKHTLIEDKILVFLVEQIEKGRK